MKHTKMKSIVQPSELASTPIECGESEVGDVDDDDDVNSRDRAILLIVKVHIVFR